MRIGILGTGMVGQALAAKLAQAGHEVMVGTRDPAATLARDEPHPVYGIPPFSVWYEPHPDAKLGRFADAAAHGELVVNATAGETSLDALRQAGEATSPAGCWSTSPTPSTTHRACPPPCSWPTPTHLASASSVPSRPSGWSRPSTP